MRRLHIIGKLHKRRVSIHALLAECDDRNAESKTADTGFNPRTPCGVRPSAWGHPPPERSFNPRTPCGVRLEKTYSGSSRAWFQSTHSLRSATSGAFRCAQNCEVSIHALLAECDRLPENHEKDLGVSIHALLAECDEPPGSLGNGRPGFNPRTPCGVRPYFLVLDEFHELFQSTHSLRSATAPDLIHCYSTEQIILCANLPKKTVIARLLFLSIYLSIFYSQCITPIADLPGNSCELEVGAQAMFNSL